MLSCLKDCSRAFRAESVRAASACAVFTVVSWVGFSTSCFIVSIGVSLRSGTSNCCAHCRTERSVWDAKPSPSTGFAGVFRVVPNLTPPSRRFSTTSFFSASARGLSLSWISSASTRFFATSNGSAISSRLQIHRSLVGADVELADVHLGAEELGADFLGRVLGERLGEEPDQDRDDQEKQEQRPDGLPAEDLHGHRLTPAGRGGRCCTPSRP